MASISAATMKDQLLTLEDVYARLGETEPLVETKFSMNGTLAPTFTLPDGWNVGLKPASGMLETEATVTVDGKEFSLTKDAILEATSSIGLTKDYVCKTPGGLVQQHVNYWFQHADRDMKLLSTNDKGLAFTKAKITPFSNIALLDRAVDSIGNKYGKNAEIYADYKFHHDLRRTAIRLIVPEYTKVITSARHTAEKPDEWSTGIQIRNSIIGETMLEMQGYLFAWWCTNGAISTHSETGSYAFNRRTQAQDDVYAWARNSVDEILGGLEHEFESVQQLTEVQLGEDINDVLADLFQQYKIAPEAREGIIERLIASDDLTMYGMMNAVTAAANSDSLSDTIRTSLMEVGGDLPRSTAARCAACHRLGVGH